MGRCRRPVGRSCWSSLADAAIHLDAAVLLRPSADGRLAYHYAASAAAVISVWGAPPPMAGISGTATEGADSIVVSGGYEDDEDHGDEIIYTGAGGNDPRTKKQIADQTLDRQVRQSVPIRCADADRWWR